MRYFLLFLILIFLGCGKGNNDINGIKLSKRIIIPVYFYDLDKWGKISSYSNEIVIVNPSNGPGSVKDGNYEYFIENLVDSNNTPIGYIYTKWGNRNLEYVKDDIDKWLNFYPKIKGFFVDEVNGSFDKLNYYKNLKNYISSKGSYFIFLNPGIIPHKDYYDLADGVVVFEGDVKKLTDNVCKNSFKSAIIVYGASINEMKKIINNYNCKYFYITDDTLPSPYDTLPSYFDEEIELLK